MNTSRPLGMRYLSFCSAVALLVGVLVPLMAGPARAAHDTRTLEVTPETASAVTGTTHVLTATLSAAAVTPIEIDFEVESGPVITKVSSTPDGSNDVPGTGNDGNTPMSPDLGCVVAATQTTCTVSFTSAVVGTNLVRGWIDHDGLDATDPTAAGPAGDGMEAAEPRGESAAEDPAWFLIEEPNTTDAVEVTWTAATPDEFVLDCEPETASTPVGTAHTITCTANAADDDAPAPGKQVDVEMSGANDPDGAASNESPDLTCTTAANGTCSVTHPAATSTANGETTYRAWIDADGNNTTVEANTSEPRDETGPAWVLTGNEPNATDVVAKTWTGGPNTLTMAPATDTGLVGTCSPYLITLSTGATPVAGRVIDVEQVHESAAGILGDEPDVKFCTPTTGSNPSGVDESKGDSQETPDDPATAGGETTTATNASGQVVIGVSVSPAGSSDGTGDVVITAFFDGNNDDDPTAGEPQDSSTQTWEPGGPRTIECQPAAGDEEVGSEFEVTCTVTDRNADELDGVDVVFAETGMGDFVSPADEDGTTDQAGMVKTHLVSDTEGEQVVTATIAEDTGAGEPAGVDECDRAAGDPTGAPAGQCRDTVTITWTDASIDPRCDDPGVICGTDGGDVIVGTAGDDLIICGDGDDTVEAMGGDDTVECGNGNDEIDGGGGSDHLKGQGGNDTITGGGGNDSVSGGSGKDRLLGGKGKDKLRGGSGNDTLKGGSGDDSINGGPGKDTCVPGKGKDKVTNCEN